MSSATHKRPDVRRILTTVVEVDVGLQYRDAVYAVHGHG